MPMQMALANFDEQGGSRVAVIIATILVKISTPIRSSLYFKWKNLRSGG
jgi:hypothetical protein